MTTLQNTFLKEKSFENYSDSSVLETMLTAAEVQGNIPAMINNLYDAFGTFKGILEARPYQLMQVPHVTEKAATMISMIAPLARVWERCNMEDPKRISNARDAQSFGKFLLMGERTERFYVIALNAQCHVLGVRRISEGSLSEVSAYPRSVAETALNYNAHRVLFCHNHPGGTCAPSVEDIASTNQLQRMLNSLNIHVVDHIIVAGSQTYSMAQHGDIDFCMRRTA